MLTCVSARCCPVCACPELKPTSPPCLLNSLTRHYSVTYTAGLARDGPCLSCPCTPHLGAPNRLGTLNKPWEHYIPEQGGHDGGPHTHTDALAAE
jgi:hypothetical protein